MRKKSQNSTANITTDSGQFFDARQLLGDNGKKKYIVRESDVPLRKIPFGPIRRELNR